MTALLAAHVTLQVACGNDKAACKHDGTFGSTLDVAEPAPIFGVACGNDKAACKHDGTFGSTLDVAEPAPIFGVTFGNDKAA
ncbi:MAG: hypothetical protein R2830_19535 [Saprospiraceae bacterium]